LHFTTLCMSDERRGEIKWLALGCLVPVYYVFFLINAGDRWPESFNHGSMIAISNAP
jgi:hypothetical protein